MRARYPAALIDEFQDTDPVQYEIFRRLFRRGSGKFPGTQPGVAAVPACRRLASAAVGDVIYQIEGGIRSGMGYCGVSTIPELCVETEFHQVTTAGLRESHPHDVVITREAPNYSL